MSRAGRPAQAWISPPGEWQEHAECGGSTPELADKFHARATNVDPDVIALCHRCPVRNECLEHALSFGQENQHGFWGGKSAQARRKMLRRRNRKGSNS